MRGYLRELKAAEPAERLQMQKAGEVDATAPRLTAPPFKPYEASK